MKKALLIVITVLAAGSAAAAPAAEPSSLNVLLTGGPEQNVISVRVSLDGTSYLIDSIGPLEAPTGVCLHREEKETALSCEAVKIASFEVNAGAGDDSITIAPKVPVAVTLRGAGGDDRLYGGAGSDKLVGGVGADTIYGRAGDDWIYGGRDDDVIYGGPGNDLLKGGPGFNEIFGGPGKNKVSLSEG